IDARPTRCTNPSNCSLETMDRELLLGNGTSDVIPGQRRAVVETHTDGASDPQGARIVAPVCRRSRTATPGRPRALAAPAARPGADRLAASRSPHRAGLLLHRATGRLPAHAADPDAARQRHPRLSAALRRLRQSPRGQHVIATRAGRDDAARALRAD